MAQDARPQRIKPRRLKGFRDLSAAEVRARDALITRVREVYERYGYVPLETPALEYVDCLGKFLPEATNPEEGIFALRDEDDNWIALRYDLTAPLSRFVAMNPDLPTPYRRYQVGPVYRVEKPGPGRYREFLPVRLRLGGHGLHAGGRRGVHGGVRYAGGAGDSARGVRGAGQQSQGTQRRARNRRAR